MKVLAADTETALIGPNAIAPKMMCLTVAARGKGGELVADLVSNGDHSIAADLESMLEPGHRLVCHFAAFDLAVIARSYPNLEPAIWAKLEAGEIVCTKLRAQLLNLSTSGKLDTVVLPDGSVTKISYSLAALVLRSLGIDISASKGEDTWRMRYSELDGLPAEKYPVAASQYAKDDAAYTLRVYEEQEHQIETEDGRASVGTQEFQAAADFALINITIEGMATDAERFEEVKKALELELSDEKLALIVAEGVLRAAVPPRPYANGATHPDGTPKMVAGIPASVDKKRLTEVVEQVASAAGIKLRKTTTGATSTDADTIASLAEFSPILAEFQHRQKLQKLVTTEIPRMCWEGELANVVHFPFRCLVETGRTSSAADKLYPSGNGQQIDPRVRGCFVPRKGFLLYSVDYGSLELVTLAQVCYSLFGYSTLRDKINAGVKPHAFLGAQLAYAFDADFKAKFGEGATPEDIHAHFMTYKTSENRAFFDHYYTFAKPVGLGFPGGLGAETFVAFAKGTYGVDLEAVGADLDFEETNAISYYRRKLLIEQGQWTRTLKGIALALRLKDLWLATYPEMVDLFKFVEASCKDSNHAEIGYREDGRPIPGYCYTTPMGMHRAGASYTAACNGIFMQSPAAEGAKGAAFELVRATRDRSRNSCLFGTRVVNFVHDEFLGEIPEDELRWERIREVERIMVCAMRRITPDVKVSVDACFMRRWDSAAKPAVDEVGRLAVWEPKESAWKL